ncbi:MAG: methylenetetrahydrofolate reductase C-terminal domain-containing protein [Deltaproteobacteria bacterium]|nr:methylenetetrahydrofolate reductase C-terminal domain-containing protein [Deltaproteobacteria bacterium]
MIVAEPKPLQEVALSVSGYKNVLILGCGTCVTVCLTGGDKEAHILAEELSASTYFDGKPPSFIVKTIERQCEKDMVEAYLDIPQDIDAILSTACGAGVQTVSEVFKDIPVLPALNTTFLGSFDEPGVWREKCQGCGNCILALTAGICPIARCAKRLLNGPCGGSSKGKCEINPDIDCAWHLIIERLERLGRTDHLSRIIPARDWSTDRDGGPRKLVRPDRVSSISQ